MFFDKEDEDTDFLNPGGSKLGALFGMDKAGSQGGNESLTYTAPKQPKKKETSPPGKTGAPVVMFAVAVHAYKYVDSKYASQGKLGAAILANHAASEYSILMYVTQQQQITTAKITTAFSYTTQANNYANFYDDARQSWSVLFDSEQNSMEFSKHVCLAKALSTGPTPTSLFTQDLAAGEGGVLETGDSVEVKYTGKLLTNNSFGHVFDTNVNADKLFRFKLGAGKVIKAWDTGVVGMRKGGKRFLVAPPSLAYGSQGMANRIPADATLLFEIEVVRVKLVGRESLSAPAQPTPKPQQPSGPVLPGGTGPMVPGAAGDGDDFNDDEDVTVKERTKSISEQLAHSPSADTSKAKLISRMAKMGRPMLPLSGAIPAHPDSEEEPVPESPQPASTQHVPQEVHRPLPKPAHVNTIPQSVNTIPQPSQPQQVYQQTSIQNQVPMQPAFLQNLPGAQQMAVFQPQQNFLQQQQQATMMQSGYPSQMFQNAPQQAVPGSSFPPYVVQGMSQGTDMMLLSETRQQNTEVRLSLSKMSDKVEQILQKMDQAQTQRSGSSMLPNMETSVLLHNITRIVQENERLKQDVFEKSGKIEAQNEKISELLQRNQSYVEKSQVLMEQRNEGLLSSANQTQHKVLALEQEKVEFTKQLSEASSQISALQQEVTSLKKREFELSQQIENSGKSTRKQHDELETLKSQHTEDESMIRELQRQLKEEKQARKTMEASLSHIQEEMADLQEAKQALEKNLLERKRKAAEERRQLEDEQEDVKANLEAEIQSLKEKLRKQKTSSSTASQEQISQLEEEITRDWQAKTERQLAVAAEKNNRAIQVLQEEKQEVEAKVQDLENKIHSMRQSSSGSEQRVQELEEQIEQLAVWKDKYESVRSNASTMKERFEERISELETEVEALSDQLEAAQKELEAVKSRPATTLVAAPSAAGADNLVDEVKKIMNSVYKQMRDTFEAEENYTGSEILTEILNSIKRTTLSLVQRGDQKADNDEEAEESDEEEESEEEEEEDEEEEDESDSEKVQEVTEQITESTVPPTETVKPSKPNVQNRNTDNNVEDNADSDKPDVEEDVEQTVNEIDKAKEENNEDAKSYTDELDLEIENSKDSNLDTEKSKTDNSTDVLKENHPVESVDDANTQNEEQTEDVPAEPSPVKRAGSLEDLLDSALQSKPKVEEISATPLVSTEPPPLTDDESSDDQEKDAEKNRTKSIFGDDEDDDIVGATLGLKSKPLVNGDTVQKGAPKQSAFDEDLKPKPPPPLFGDDDDDDDLDWLS